MNKMKKESIYQPDKELLESRLVNVYDHYFPFKKVHALSEYMGETGVNVGKGQYLKISYSPLRIELVNEETNKVRILWQMIGYAH